MSLLSEQQINDLASIVIDECGSRLTDDQLTEHIYLLLENIAGCEQCHSMNDEIVDRVFHEIKRQYNESTNKENRDPET